MAILFISTGWIQFLSPTLDSADPYFALVIKTRFQSGPRRGGRVANQAPAIWQSISTYILINHQIVINTLSSSILKYIHHLISKLLFKHYPIYDQIINWIMFEKQS